ncbi:MULTISPECIES: hypothetical protein [Methanobacterium]|uniref:PepSY domain-containing protein n=1 Tax=Methanobacterium bryantii TaxID=2161 RepID=A0A2A2H2P5_METBR|nr:MULTISPECIES: hypothetical protein [Methanobacterium]OEC86486.1 hypothetical protein A9507_10750 [Methanobacterium sp. A39]PAV03635.1 hypothetical protein ASJ80_01290 [Methanobacterium bryantii]
MVAIKGKILFLVSALVITSITVSVYPVISANSPLGRTDQPNLGNPTNNNHKISSINKISNRGLHQSDLNVKSSIPKKYTTSKIKAKSSKSQLIARKYIKEPNAVAGKPEKYKIGGKCTDVVPVLLKGKRVGEINIDPKSGKNVGGAGGAP